MFLRRHIRNAVHASALVVALASGGSLAHAAPPGKPAKAPATPKVTLAPDLAQRLASQDPAQAKAALDEVRVAGKDAASLAPAVAGILDRGTTAAMAIDVLETLADLEVEATSANIVPYLAHRDRKVREAAATALVRTKGFAASKGLRHALADIDPRVRAIAAAGLGSMRARDAFPDLMLAFQHRIAEAAVSIGQLCIPKECESFLGQIGRQPFDVMSNGVDQILFRPAAEVGDETKIKIIGKVRELGTKEATAFLVDVQKRWPAKVSPKVKQALDQAVAATGNAIGESGKGGAP